jgi:serine/threonine-protein kinase RsbW
LLADVGRCSGKSATAITAHLLERVRAFASGVPQSDDIAILTLKVNAGACMHLELHATPQEVMRGVDALRTFAAAQQVPENTVFGLTLALEECCSNIVNHALKRDARRTFHVVFERTSDSFVIELRDDGPTFDPTLAVPDNSHAVEDQEPGGWGIALIRRSIDDIRYRHEAGRNVLRLTRRLASTVLET